MGVATLGSHTSGKGTDALMSISDLLFEFTDWLRGTSLTELSLAINDLSLSLWIQTHFWAIPTIQTVHILSIGALFGSAMMISLRVLGVTGMSRTMAQTTHRYIPWIWWALVLLAISGLLLIIGEPVRELINPIFWIKMVLIIVAVIATLAFNGAVKRRAAKWDAGASTGGLRLAAILLLILWCAVMFGGRWIAYAPV